MGRTNFSKNILQILNKHFANLSIQKKLFFSSLILTIAILAAVGITSQNNITSLLIKEQVNYNINSFRQAERYFSSVFERTDACIQKVYANSIIRKNMTDSFNEQNYSMIFNIQKSLDRELGNIIYSNDYIDYVVLLCSNDFAYTFKPNTTGQYLGDDFNYDNFSSGVRQSVLVNQISLPFIYTENNLQLSGDSGKRLRQLLDGRFILVRELKNTSNSPDGTIIVVYKNSFFTDILPSEENNRSLYLLDENMSFLWSDTEAVIPYDSINFPAINRQDESNFFMKTMDGRKMLCTYDKLSPYNFTILSLTPMEQLLGKSSGLQSYMIFYIIACFLFTFVLSYIFSKKISQPLHILSNKLSSDISELNDYLVSDTRTFMHRLSLQVKIILFFTITVILSSVIFVSTLCINNYYIYKNKINELTVQTIKQAKWNIDYKFSNYDRITSQIIYSDEFQKTISVLNHMLIKLDESGSLERIMGNAKASNKEILSMNIYDKAGNILYSSNYSDMSPITATWTDFLGEMQKNTGRLEMLGIQKDNNMNQVIIFARKIRSINQNGIGKLLGYFVMTVDQEIIDNIVKKIELGDSGYFFITDSKGDIFLHDNQELTTAIFKSGNNLNEITANSNTSLSISYRKQSYLLFNHASDFYKLRVFGVMPKNEIFRKVYQLIWYSAGFLLICIVFILLVSTFIAKNITKPLKKIQNAMNQISNGNFDVQINVKGKDEIAILSKYFNQMIIKLNSLIQENYKSKIRENELLFLEKEAQLNALQQQINPHFLYNTLEAIKWMAYKKGVMEICEMATALGKFFRGSITKGKDFVTFADEMEHLQNYIYIQQLRYQDKFRMVWEVNDEVKQYKTIKLILQPIVENAITHGMDNMETGGLIRIVGYKEYEMIYFKIEDNGNGMTAEQLNAIKKSCSEDDSTRNGIGIKNVNRRLKLYYLDKCYFDIDSIEGAGTIVKFGIPALLDFNEANSFEKAYG